MKIRLKTAYWKKEKDWKKEVERMTTKTLILSTFALITIIFNMKIISIILVGMMVTINWIIFTSYQYYNKKEKVENAKRKT